MAQYQSLIVYDSSQMHLHEDQASAELLVHLDLQRYNWLSMIGIQAADREAVAAVLAHLRVEPWLLDQIFDDDHLEFQGEYENCLYAELDVLAREEQTGQYRPVRTSLILGERFLLVFSVQRLRLFERLQVKLLEGKTKAQEHGPDYLLYLLIKTAYIDNYYQHFREFERSLEEVEDRVIAQQAPEEVYKQILELRERVKPFYRYLTELQDFTYVLKDEESRFIRPESLNLFTRRLDHEAEALAEEYRRLRAWIHELLEIHRANISENSNRIIKILTVVSSIFLPLTFVAGVYGMNFRYMPELLSVWGYPLVLLLMLAIAVGELIYMRRREWI